MIEIRNSSIQQKIIKPSNIVSIAQLFFAIYNELLQEHNEKTKEMGVNIGLSPSVSFSISTSDSINYSTDNLDLFQSDGIVFQKVLNSVVLPI